MNTVTFWFDPICPFTWRTSRWLRGVAPRRNAQVEWRVMSLGILNEGKEIPQQFRARMEFSRQAQRLLTAVGEVKEFDGIDALYTALGTRLHDNDEEIGHQLLVDALADAGLPADLIAATEDARLDEAIRASHQAAQERVGTESGSPVFAIGYGPGFFGPVVVPIPEDEDAERLFDAVALLSTVPQFSELKRARADF